MISAAIDYVFNGIDDAETKAVGMPKAYLRLLSSIAASDVFWLDSNYQPGGVTSEQLAIIERGLYQEELAMELALGQSINMLQMFPGIVGIWPMSVTDGAGRAIDVSGNGLHLTNNGSPGVNYGVYGAQFLHSDSRSLSHVNVASLNVTGSEPHIFFANRGLTVGCWFQRVLIDSYVGLVKKRDANGKGVILGSLSSGKTRAAIGNGAIDIAVDSLSSVGLSEWNFSALSFDPGVSIGVWFNDELTKTATTDTAIVNDASTFYLGDRSGIRLSGYMRLAFVAASHVSSEEMLRFYNTSRVLFQ